MAAEVTIKVDASRAAKRLKGVFNGKTLPMLADTILADCNTYVRVDQGTLRASAHIEDGGKRIVWSTKYAKKVYYTGTPDRTINANASLRWCEVAKKNHSKEWAARATELLRGGST